MVNKTQTLLTCNKRARLRYVIGMNPFNIARLAWDPSRVGTNHEGRKQWASLSV